MPLASRTSWTMQNPKSTHPYIQYINMCAILSGNTRWGCFLTTECYDGMDFSPVIFTSDPVCWHTGDKGLFLGICFIQSWNMDLRKFEPAFWSIGIDCWIYSLSKLILCLCSQLRHPQKAMLHNTFSNKMFLLLTLGLTWLCLCHRSESEASCTYTSHSHLISYQRYVLVSLQITFFVSLPNRSLSRKYFWKSATVCTAPNT